MDNQKTSHIKVATPDLSDAIAELVNGAYRGDAGQYGWTTEANLLGGLRTDRDRVRDLIEASGSVVLVKVQEDRVEGCVHLEKKDAITAYLGMLTTNVRAQTRGTGSELLKAAEEYAKAYWRSSLIEMTVIDSRQELIAYYVRRGYETTGEKRPFPNDPRFGVSLVGPIEFIVLEKELT